MGHKLHLLVCPFFAHEAKHIVRTEGWSDVSVRVFPSLCCHANVAETTVRRLCEASSRRGPAVILLGSCLGARGGTPRIGARETCRLYHVPLCFHLLLPEEDVDRHLRDGDYLITPGWLQHWRRQMREWHFDAPTARNFFAESARRIVLLDTDSDTRTPRRLSDLGRFTGRPCVSVPTGTDHFRRILAGIVDDGRHGHPSETKPPRPQSDSVQ